MVKRNKLKHSRVESFFDRNFDPEKRVIYLGGKVYSDGTATGVDEDVAANTIKAIYLLNDLSSDPIRIMINNSGGNVEDGLAIYDMMRNSKSPVDVEVIGQGYSIATIIMQAGRFRYMHPSSYLMIHESRLSGNLTSRELQSWGRWSRTHNQRMYEIFASRTGKSAKKWEAMCQEDHDLILSAKEAVKMGLADRVLRPARWAV